MTRPTSGPTRRDFLALSASGAAVGMLGSPAAGRATVAGPSGEPDRAIRVAVVGLRSRGWRHALGLQRLAGCRVVALCDVDSAILARRAAECAAGAEDRPPFEVETTGDVRTLLGRDDIDAISIATPYSSSSFSFGTVRIDVYASR